MNGDGAARGRTAHESGDKKKGQGGARLAASLLTNELRTRAPPRGGGEADSPALSLLRRYKEGLQWPIGSLATPRVASVGWLLALT